MHDLIVICIISILLLCVCSSSTSPSTDTRLTPCANNPLHNPSRWFLGQVSFGGLCNQLFGLYSQIPIAMLLNASLLLNSLYSRNNFEQSWIDIEENYVRLPFSLFYDVEYFQTYWKQLNNLTIVEMTPALNVCLSNYNISYIYQTNVAPPLSYDTYIPSQHCSLYTLFTCIYYLIKRKFTTMCPFQHDCRIYEHLYYSNLTHPLSPSVQFITMHSTMPLNSIYSFWQTSQHIRLLQHVHSSLRPSPPIQHELHQLWKYLNTSNYWALHLRLEGNEHTAL
jgi:hypothetical protein